jgi:3-hydroxyisobutyrate dehydrogenase
MAFVCGSVFRFPRCVALISSCATKLNYVVIRQRRYYSVGSAPSSESGIKQSKSRVGFIGLGQMGLRMVKNVLKGGHPVVVHDINSQVTETLAREYRDHVIVARNPRELLSKSDVTRVITMLPSSPQVAEVYVDGADSLLRGYEERIRDGAFASDVPLLLIDASTIDPNVARRLQSVLAKESSTRPWRIVAVDAPVSGGVSGAEKGTLTFMVGGSQEGYELAKPLLQLMGQNIIHCGGPGTGQVAKVCNNLLLGISMIGVSEAFHLGIKLGMDPKILNQIINSSSGRCWTSEVYNPVPGVLPNAPATRGYQGGFGVPLMAKDLTLAVSAAMQTNTSLPLGSLASQIYTFLATHGYAQFDFSVVYQWLSEEKKTH